METVPISDLKTRFAEFAEKAGHGQTITVTRDGAPVFQLVPHKHAAGINFAALEAFQKKHPPGTIVTYIADDFDAPLPEDFLLRPLTLWQCRKERP